MMLAAIAGSAPRRRLLFVTPFAPDLEGAHGGARATGAIIAMLAAHHDVWVVYPAPAGASAPRRLPGRCRGITAVDLPAIARPGGHRPLRTARLLLWGDPAWADQTFSPAMMEAVASAARRADPDVVHFEYHVMGRYIPAARMAAPRAACIVTEHEPGIAAEDLAGVGPPLKSRLGRLARRRAWQRFETRMLAQADAVIAFTQSDSAKVRALLRTDGPQVACIPFRLPLATGRASKPIPSDVLFIGNFNHPPNAEAASRLVRSIAPKVRAAIPDATFRIVGADPPAWLLGANDAATCVTGEVEDTVPYLSGASVIVAPLRQGGGMRVKVIEACVHGKALVATPCAVSGLSLRDRSEFLLAERDEALAAAIVALLRDPPRRAELGQAARAWAERTQAPGAWLAQYEQLHRGLRARAGSSEHL